VSVDGEFMGSEDEYEDGVDAELDMMA